MNQQTNTLPMNGNLELAPDLLIPAKDERPLRLRTFGLTDRGKVRSVNEDQFLVAVLTQALQVQYTSLPQPAMQYGNERGHLFIVADGVGGHQGGEQASALAVNTIERFVLNAFKWLLQLKESGGAGILTEFHAALRQTDTQICQAAHEQSQLWGMGTTVTLAYSLGRDLFIAHVGHSRCYLFREAKLRQLTHDHTVVQEMVSRGLLGSKEAKEHPWRHVISNVVGGSHEGVQPEVHKVGLEANDVLLLCTDGLTEMVPDKTIASILKAESDPRRACEKLLAQANDSDGRDNITVVVARYEAASE
jgi:protein phosphatase